MPVPEFRLWWAYDKHLEPFGREWEQVWRIVSALMTKRDGTPLRMDECTPLSPPPMTPAELAAQVARMSRREG